MMLFEVCLLLNCDADAEQLYLAGRSVAGIRAGYGAADDGVLLNLHIKPLDSHTFLADRNFAMARLFGAENKVPVQWSLSSAVMGEVSRMMPECTQDTKNRCRYRHRLAIPFMRRRMVQSSVPCA